MEALEWERAPDGTIDFFPYVGHRTATLSADIGVLRLTFVSTHAQPDEDAHGLQLALSRDQARILGESLLKLADAPHIPEPPTGVRH